MALKVVGAGLGRTGTMSLKLALERLTGQPCYHMVEVFKRPQDVAVWHAASKGESVDWKSLFEDYGAAVDWPAASFWSELADEFPDAIVVMSVRDPDSWWQSASQTIFATNNWDGLNVEWRAMVMELMSRRFTTNITDRDACVAAFEKHYLNVRATIPPDRLVEWNPAQGWAPLCSALGVAVPDEPLPHVNTREDWAQRHGANAQT